MLTMQHTDSSELISMSLEDKSVEELLRSEWLLTNLRGGYSSSTVISCNSRRYHGLLIGSLNPPGKRVMALSNILEMIIYGDKVFDLSTFEFNERFTPSGFGFIKCFRRDVGAHFDYSLEHLEFTKSVYLMRESDTVAVVYEFSVVEKPFEFVLRPFVGLRDSHELQKSYAPIRSAELGESLFICHDVPGSCELLLNCSSMNFEKDQQWWFNFVYRSDKERGQDFVEDLWTPGFYKCQIDSPTKIVFWAHLGKHCSSDTLAGLKIKTVLKDLQKHQKVVVAGAKTKDLRIRALSLAADQFICKRQVGDSSRTTILAGFPWFVDWGRDAFVSLPGLLLSTGKFDDAKSVLKTFAGALDEGMIPSRFDDRGDTAYFNSIDASLWFINAAFQYLEAVRDVETFREDLLGAILSIIEAYQKGTKFDIRADSDGLITGGSEQTQLTWMDAKYGGIAFTPRSGKAVEVNALWYDSLSRLAKYYATCDIEKAKHFDLQSDVVGRSFCELFWNETTGYLNDCVSPDGTVDSSLRPNQIFAVSLSFSPLSEEQQKRVVNTIREKLLTPFGLRTLNAEDNRYKGKYNGPQRQRDEAYHQGTVWPYLMGPFIEAYLKVNDFSNQSKLRAESFIEPLIKHLTEDGCLGSISEIFDGDWPHNPRGCFAQAWSVAELLRVSRLVYC